MSWTEWLMVFLGLKLVAAVMVALWSLERGKNRRATVCMVVALVYLAFFAWAQNRAESEHELKHAVEKSVVQEQVEAVREF